MSQLVDLSERFRDAQKASLEHDLRGAVVRRELHLEYQPIVSTAGQRITGVEALVRWDHPSRGSVDPASFIPITDQSPFRAEIGRWALEAACGDRSRWRTLRGAPGLHVSLDVSARQLLDPDFSATVADILSIDDTDPGSVTLELTEKVFIRDADWALVVLGELKDVGVMLALDGFGAGNSSLTYLKRFPIDVVKVDRSLIAELDLDRATHAIVAAVVGLAHELGMTVVADGVETLGQLDESFTLVCDAWQGPYLAGPMTSEDLDTLIRRPPDAGFPALPRAPAASG
ncbi:MAG: EAL domain-containing protein [Actinomycetota bacterium]